MPRLRPLAALVVAAAALATPAAAQAGALVADAPSCADQALDQVFLPWADPMHYTLAPGGDAEGDGLTLRGSAVVTEGNEPWNVGGEGTMSVTLRNGGSLETGTMCVGIEHPTVRFFTRSTGTGLLSGLKVEVLTETLLGGVTAVPVVGTTILPTFGAWTPTLPGVVASSLLPLLPGAHTPVRFRITAVGSGAWQVDDVYVDPYKGR